MWHVVGWVQIVYCTFGRLVFNSSQNLWREKHLKLQSLGLVLYSQDNGRDSTGQRLLWRICNFRLEVYCHCLPVVLRLKTCWFWHILKFLYSRCCNKIHCATGRITVYARSKTTKSLKRNHHIYLLLLWSWKHSLKGWGCLSSIGISSYETGAEKKSLFFF